MRLVSLSEAGGYEVVAGHGDVRGWAVVDGRGQALGRVVDLLFRPETGVVEAAVLAGPDDRLRTLDMAGLDLRPSERALVLMDGPEGQTGLPGRFTLAEERLVVGKRRVKTGEVSITRRPVVEEVREDVTLYDEDVEITRRLVDRPATGDEGVTVEGDTVRVPVIAERLVIERRPYVTEEILITKRRTPRIEHVTEHLRHDELTISGPGATFASAEPVPEERPEA